MSSDAQIKTVAVFGASGRQGLAQVQAALSAGYQALALTRNPDNFPMPATDGLTIMAADYHDTDSLVRACGQADAVFVTPPSFTDAVGNAGRMVAIAQIAQQAGVKRLVLNTSMFVPDEPMGEPIYDGRLALENAIEETGVPLTVFRPVLFMDNLLTDWVLPVLAAEDTFVYPHNPDMQANWICLDDVAAFMVGSLRDPGFVGKRIVIGGPETLRPGDVANILSDVLGRRIAFRQSSPREFAKLLNGIFHDVLGVEDDVQIGMLEAFYRYNNASEARPMVVDTTALAKSMSVTLTPLKEWARRQDWRPRPQGAAAPIGG